MEIRLSRDSWHFKLQTLTFGREPHFANFCPYFWLTILALLISPIALPFVGLKKLITQGVPAAFEWFGNTIEPALELLWSAFEWFDANVCLPLEEATIRHLDPDKIIGLYLGSHYAFLTPDRTDEQAWADWIYCRADSQKEFKKIKRLDDKFRLWIRLCGGDNWRERLEAARIEWDKNESIRRAEDTARTEARKFADQQSELRRRALLTKLSVWTQRTVALWGTLLVLGAARLLWVVGRVLYRRLALWPWADIFTLLLKIPHAIWHAFLRVPWGVVGIGMLMVLAVFGFSFVVSYYVRKCDLEVPDLGFLRAVRWVVRQLGRPVVLLINAVHELILFVAEYVALFKKDHCPSIKWES